MPAIANQKAKVEIIFPAGNVNPDILAEHCRQLAAHFDINYQALKPDPDWPYCSARLSERSNALNHALLNDDNDIIIAARGGYGCSDLLPLIPWQQLKQAKPKTLLGFSDISALLSAIHCQLQWPVIHGPMPGSPLWGQHGLEDIDALIALLEGERTTLTLGLSPIKNAKHAITGYLFGGCLSVLSNLIGTPYLPKTLTGKLIFFEDTGENPAQVIRHLNQWQQSGLLNEARALILGRFLKTSKLADEGEQLIYNEVAKRLNLPLYHCPLLGHQSPNMPLPFFKHAKIQAEQLLI